MVERASHPHRFFTAEEKQEIVEAIRAAEKGTTGEIQVHLDRRSRGEVMDRAKKVFHRQRMHRRKHRNAVLIYLSLADRSFAVLGDKGIHRRVGDSFWREIAHVLQQHFSSGQFSDGLKQAIQKIGESFREHFPIPASCR